MDRNVHFLSSVLTVLLVLLTLIPKGANVNTYMLELPLYLSLISHYSVRE